MSLIENMFKNSKMDELDGTKKKDKGDIKDQFRRIGAPEALL